MELHRYTIRKTKVKRDLLLARNSRGKSKKVLSVPRDRKGRDYLREL